MEESIAKTYLQKSLDEWKDDISQVLSEIAKEYDQVAQELKVYSYKYGITKQVIQSTVNEELIGNIREMYHKPFEENYNQLKEYIKDLEEKRRVFDMFIKKIDEVIRKESKETSSIFT
jgi:predicted patatin/cPLA2 family phospholipase